MELSSSTINELGLLNEAVVAGPVPEVNTALPVPAIVEIIPVAPTTWRILKLLESAIVMSPWSLTCTPYGPLSSACEPSPPSPADPAVPLTLPTTVEMIPPLLTMRIRLPSYSLMYTAPLEETNK